MVGVAPSARLEKSVRAVPTSWSALGRGEFTATIHPQVQQGSWLVQVQYYHVLPKSTNTYSNLGVS